MPHRIFAVLLALGVAALIASTISLIIASVTRSTPSSATATLPKTASGLDVGGLLAGIVSHNGNPTKQETALLLRPYIAFIGDTLSPSDQRLAGTLEVIIPPGVPPQMTDAAGKPLFNCPASGSCTPVPGHQNDTINASMLVTKGSANYEVEQPLKLSDLFKGSILGIHDFTVPPIPLKGFAGQYPQDDYTADISIALSFPSKQQFNTGKYAQVRTVDSGPVSNTYATSVTTSPRYQKIVSNYPDTFAFSAKRDWYNEFFVYAVACIPLLFAILFFHLLFISRGEGGGLGKSFEHFTEALVLSVLSVLPLRVVLVPGNIDGLTRVDLVLGLGLVAIVTVAAGKYVSEIWGFKGTPQTEGDEVGEREDSAVAHPSTGAAAPAPGE
ncbi:MAG TPA: hypothetical protein VFB34_00995 [Chloroflexota bacterium]|nr:hypothetical protein [Chloroflexota bacterium]